MYFFLFEAFQIADPFQPAEDGSAANSQDASSSIGHCVTDRLNVIGVGAAIPTICGFNTGQHSKLHNYRTYAIHSRTKFSNFSLFCATIFQVCTS